MNINVTRIDRSSNGMIQFYNGADVVDSFSITSSVSVGFENNLAKTIVFSNSVKTLSFNVFNLTTLYGATSSKVFASGVDPSDTGSAYINRLYDIYGFLISDMVQGCCPGPSFVGGVVASYPNYASFPATGQHSVIYIDESTSQAYFWNGTSYQLLVSSSVTPSALTKTDDTNVTLTLGGTPGSSLLQAVSLTLGWTGTLADSRIASATNWNTAYTNRITSLTTTGSGAATLIANVLNIPTPAAATFSSLTTTGSSGSSTLSAGVLNVPTYTLSGLGGQPLATNLTSLAGLAYVSASFVKMTAAGTFALDTNTYLTGITSSQVTTALGYTPVTNARTINTTAPLAGGGDLTANRTLSITQANTSTDGYLSSADYRKFNGKFGGFSYGLFIASSPVVPGAGEVYVMYSEGDPYEMRISYTTSDGITLMNNYFINNLVGGNSIIIRNQAGEYCVFTNAGYAVDYGTYCIISVGGYLATTPSSFTNANCYITFPQNPILATVNGTSLYSNVNIVTGTVTSVAALTIGTTGTNITSTVATGTTTPVITLNIPTASAANRGALSAADWTTFNGKQAALVSGTNIKTINSTSLLGSGNITVGTFTLPSLTSGSVLFSDGTTIAQNNANFFWDNTNNRLGIGTASPTGAVTIIGAYSSSTAAPLVVRNTTPYGGPNYDQYVQIWLNAAGSVMGSIRNNGEFTFSNTINTAYFKSGTAGSASTPIYGGSGSNGIFFPAANTLAFTLNAVETLRMFSTNNVAIGTTTDVASSKLTIASTTQGFLPPRMTTTQKNAIASPASGLVVYDSTLNTLNTYNGSAWTANSTTVYVFNMNSFPVPNGSLFYGVYLGGTPVSPVTVATQYGGAATDFFPGYPMPAGTASTLVVVLRIAQVAPTSVVTLKLANTSTSTFGPVVTIAAGSAAGTYTDNSATVSFAVNERLSIVASNPFVIGATAGPQLTTGTFRYTV